MDDTQNGYDGQSVKKESSAPSDYHRMMTVPDRILVI
jgi:hypothetical protein